MVPPLLIIFSLFPLQVLMSRIPDGFGYDKELNVFIKDVDMHDAYKRGKATARQVHEFL